MHSKDSRSENTRSDDTPSGLIMTRREVLRALGIAGTVLLGRADAFGELPQCLGRPEQTEGPFFVDEHLERDDIRSDPADDSVRAGVPFALTIIVLQMSGGKCRPLEGATVDIWHCDAEGLYSDVEDGATDTRGHRFLRGYQVTNASGAVTFHTIYPGWYDGRTVHIHFKIRSAATDGTKSELTSQLYFDDALSDTVLSRPPYSARGPRTVRNNDDFIFRRGGEQLMLDVKPLKDGYSATFSIGLV